jgi:hypothetical protein
MRKLLYYFGLSCIAITLFILHTAFAYSLLPLFLADKYFKNLFVLQNGFDAKVYVPYIFGLTFAIAIVAIMDILQRNDAKFWKFAISVASMELIGIALLCYPLHGDIWLAISGFYYGIYLFLAIIFYFYVKPERTEKEVIAEPSHSELFKDAMQYNASNAMEDDLKKKIFESIERMTTKVPFAKEPKKNTQNRDEMFAKIKELHLQGVQQKEIALQVGRNASTVSRIINKHKNEWNEQN